MKLHDIGIQIVKNEQGEIGAAFYVGGGMGRTPMIAPLIRDFVPVDQLITYTEACLRVYNRYGRRDNKYKARIKSSYMNSVLRNIHGKWKMNFHCYLPKVLNHQLRNSNGSNIF